MTTDLNTALDESLARLRAGQATLDECLARYPAHATALRPLLLLAVQIALVPRPSQSASACAAGRARMLEALAARKRQEIHAPLWRSVWQHSGNLFFELSSRVRTRRIAFAAAIVALLIVGGISVRLWTGVAVAHAATVSNISGTLEMWHPDGHTWLPVPVGARLAPGSRLRTGTGSAATLTFFDGSLTSLDADTQLILVQISRHRIGTCTVIILDQPLGMSHYSVPPLVAPGSCFRVQTPAAMMDVQATDFSVAVDDTGATSVMVMSGLVQIAAQGGTAALHAGERTTVRPGQPPDPAGPAPAATPTPTGSDNTGQAPRRSEEEQSGEESTAAPGGAASGESPTPDLPDDGNATGEATRVPQVGDSDESPPDDEQHDREKKSEAVLDVTATPRAETEDHREKGTPEREESDGAAVVLTATPEFHDSAEATHSPDD
jgi:hypothetical protein